MLIRPRRNRASPGIRALVRETVLSPADLVLPLFVHDDAQPTPIAAMPGVHRWPISGAVSAANEAHALGIPAVALFPKVPDPRKDPVGRESTNDDGLCQRTIRAIKSAVPGLVVISDVALDPYSSDGHDGVVQHGRVDNDATLPLLAAMAVSQARAGADLVAPSDMMDGRIAAVRAALDAHGFSDVGILSYCAKYASAFYGPFRTALDSQPRTRDGIPADKTTYQMDPANTREALRELRLDEAEGADLVMVKPGLPYLDVIHLLREHTALPVAAYHVSGEYAMLKAAAERGWIDYERCLLESLTSLKRAGADVIFTYGAVDAARSLRR